MFIIKINTDKIKRVLGQVWVSLVVFGAIWLGVSQAISNALYY